MSDNAVAAALASGEWKQLTDTKGRTYFYHPATKRTVWDLGKELGGVGGGGGSTPASKPPTPASTTTTTTATPSPDDLVAAALSSGEWKQLFDEKRGKHYFVNSKTKKTVWDLKKELATGAATPMSSGNPTPTPPLSATPTPTTGTDPVAAALASGEWVEKKDKASGKTFYYNPKTKKTTWDLHKELGVVQSAGPSPSPTPQQEQPTPSSATPQSVAPTIRPQNSSLAVESLKAELKSLHNLVRFQEEEIHRLKFALFVANGKDYLPGSSPSLPTFVDSVTGMMAPSSNNSSTTLNEAGLKQRVDHLLLLNQKLQLALSDERKKRNLCAHCTGFLQEGQKTTVAAAMGMGDDKHFIPQPTQMSDDAWYFSIMKPNVSATSYLPHSHANHSWINTDDVPHRPTYISREAPRVSQHQPTAFTDVRRPTQPDPLQPMALWHYPTAKYYPQY